MLLLELLGESWVLSELCRGRGGAGGFLRFRGERVSCVEYAAAAMLWRVEGVLSMQLNVVPRTQAGAAGRVLWSE